MTVQHATQPMVRPDARTIDIDVSTMVKVLCPKCSNPLTQDNLVPGHASRHRCKRCGEWTVVYAIAVAVAAADDPSPVELSRAVE